MHQMIFLKCTRNSQVCDRLQSTEPFITKNSCAEQLLGEHTSYSTQKYMYNPRKNQNGEQLCSSVHSQWFGWTSWPSTVMYCDSSFRCVTQCIMRLCWVYEEYTGVSVEGMHNVANSSHTGRLEIIDEGSFSVGTMAQWQMSLSVSLLL